MYPQSELRELQATNRKLGADLLKSQMQLANLRKEYDDLCRQNSKISGELILEADKQTRIDIMSKRITELEAKCEAYHTKRAKIGIYSIVKVQESTQKSATGSAAPSFLEIDHFLPPVR